MSAFDDVYAGNHTYASTFGAADTPGKAGRGLGIVTCMDSRIDPLDVLGLAIGDAKIIRNAGGRVTDDVIANLVAAAHLLGVERILVIPHTDCGWAKNDDAAVHAATARAGIDSRGLDFDTVPDQTARLAHDVQRICSTPQLPAGIPVVGAFYDPKTGRLSDPVAEGVTG